MHSRLSDQNTRLKLFVMMEIKATFFLTKNSNCKLFSEILQYFKHAGSKTCMILRNEKIKVQKIGVKSGQMLKVIFSDYLFNETKKDKFFAMSAIIAILTVVSIAGIPESSAAKTKTYEITITNLTPGQPITPPLLVTHSENVGFFTVGEIASNGVQQLSENGNSEPLVKMLQGKAGISDIVQGTAPLVPANDPGNTGLNYSETFVVSAEGDMRYLSFASMLVCTNDGFAGIDSVKLPYYKQKTVYAMAYDARTEMNTEDFADMVPPCQGAIGASSGEEGTGSSNPDLAEKGIVIPHPGIMGNADLLKEVHAWSNPTVKIDIIRTD